MTDTVEIKAAEHLVSGYRGGAALVRSDGSVITANEKGSCLEALLVHDVAPNITALVLKSAAEKAIVSSTISLPGTEGEVVLEITVTPHLIPGAENDTFLVLTRDLTMERNLRSALVESRQRYKDLVDVSSDFAWEVGSGGEFVFVSPKGALGYAADQLVGKSPAEFVVDADNYDPLPFYSRKALDGVEMWMRQADSGLACVVISCLPLYGEGDVWRGARGVCRDVTRERERETALANARYREQLLNYIIGAIRDEVEPANMLTAAAAAVGRALGAAGCRIYRKTGDEEFEPAADYGNMQDVGTMDLLVDRVKDGENVIEAEAGIWQVVASPARYNQPVNGAIALWKAGRDGGWSEDEILVVGDVANQIGIVIEQASNHERIVNLSRTDSLTGLLNRRAFYEDELPRRLKRLEKSGETAALLYVDMDNFKRVNDVHGHQRGDEAILLLRDVLVEHSRAGDAIVRQGGDEFAMWIDGVDLEVATSRAKTLIASSKVLQRLSGDADHPLGISVGVAMYDPALKESLESLLHRADEAMYEVKKSGKGGYKLTAALVGEPQFACTHERGPD